MANEESVSISKIIGEDERKKVPIFVLVVFCLIVVTSKVADVYEQMKKEAAASASAAAATAALPVSSSASVAASASSGEKPAAYGPLSHERGVHHRVLSYLILLFAIVPRNQSQPQARCREGNARPPPLGLLQ